MTHLIKNVCERAYLCFMCLKVLFQIETTQLEHLKINSHPSWQNMYHNVVLQLPILVVILVAWLMRNEWELNPKKQKKSWTISEIGSASVEELPQKRQSWDYVYPDWFPFSITASISQTFLYFGLSYSEFLFQTFKASNFFICAFLQDIW